MNYRVLVRLPACCSRSRIGKQRITPVVKEFLQTTARRRPAAVPDETPLPVPGSACRLDPIPPINTCRWLSVLSRADPVHAREPLAD